MKRIGIIIALFVALFCFITSAAMAYTLSFAGYATATGLTHLSVSLGQTVEFKFNDYEVWLDNNNNGVLDVGDQLKGVFIVTSINNYSTNVNASPLGLMSGNFTYDVQTPSTGVSSTTATLIDQMNIYFNPSLSSANVTINPYQNTTDISAYIDNGDPGELVASFQSVPGQPLSASLNTNYSYTTNSTSPVWQAGTTIASIGYNPIQMIFNNTGYLWSDWRIKSDITYEDSNYPTWTFTSQDPILVTFVPEPATIMLLGAGLLGLGSWGRKKTKKDKES